MHKHQTLELREAADKFSSSHGETLSSEVDKQSELLMLWVKYLLTYHRTNVADPLLEAFGSAIRETAGALSLGLLRSALFSLRAQVDLILSWIYFKDHPVEWEYVNRTAEGFKLKSEVLKYIETYHDGYGRRFGILQAVKTRRELDPYRLLSAHIHGQSEPVLPVVNELKDMVQDDARCQQCAQVCFEVSEYLNDILLSMYASSWSTLPSNVQAAALARFVSMEQRTAFFK